MFRGRSWSAQGGRRLAVIAAALLVIGVLVASWVVLRSDEVGETACRVRYGVDGSAPDLPGVTLATLPDLERPPAPEQWAADGAVPTNQWWSSAVVGPGSEPIWAQPLAARVLPEGDVQLSNEPAQASGGVEMLTPFVPALTLVGPGPGTVTEVKGSGAFHVELSVRGGATATTLTLVQGSPFVEVTHRGGPLTFRGDGLRLLSYDSSGARVQTRGRVWSIGASGDVDVSVDENAVIVTSRDGDDHIEAAVGPEPDMGDENRAGADWVALAADLASHPLLDSVETVRVGRAGDVTQTLVVEREGAAPSAWALLPHHRELRVGELGEELGRLPDVSGSVPVHLVDRLELSYPPAPVLLAPTPLEDTTWVASLAPDLDARRDESRGSYFAGTDARYEAALADLAQIAGDAALEQEVLGLLRTRFARLLDGLGPAVAWEDRWGALVLSPAEFGSGSELNDHHLQYGYWVAAAAALAERDPASADGLAPLVDALIADYAGTEALGCVGSSSLPRLRGWNPYVGHSWASGTAPFLDGNNLESSSEAVHAWWAAARWFVATGRPAMAEPFVARFTMESHAALRRWLPVDALEDDQARPWAGVVWSAKTDLGTWFDPSPEAALGIQLLPLGSNSLARYPDAASIDATARRWDWCERHGSGCGGLWPNLLASDAVVAARPGPPTDARGAREPVTPDAMIGWWAAFWRQSPLPGALACTPGAVARSNAAGDVSVHAANPGPDELALRCVDEAGSTRWSARLASGERRVETLPPPPPP